MRLRTVAKLSIVVSVILFCIGIGLYGFAQLSMVDKGREADVLSYVPNDCSGVFETDNLDFFMNEFLQTAYAGRMESLRRAGITDAIFSDLTRSALRRPGELSDATVRILYASDRSR